MADMNTIDLMADECKVGIPNGREILYPINEISVDRMTRTVLGVCQHQIIQTVTNDGYKMAELIHAYTELYTAYKEKKKPDAEKSASD